MGASLALWDWLVGSLFMPPARSPRLTYGASGFDHDPHGVMGLMFEPAFKFATALADVALLPVRSIGHGKTPVG